MSTKTAPPRSLTLVRAVAGLLAMPATMAHELTHVLVSLPWARRVGIVYEPTTGRAAARIEWRDWAGRRARRLAAAAPLAVGLSIGLAAVVLWVRAGVALPQGAAETAKVAVLTAWWVIYTSPSGGDTVEFWGEADA